MQIVKCVITPERRANLEKLSAVLKTAVPPPEFGMRGYFSTEKPVKIEGERYDGFDLNPHQVKKKYYNRCGTVACAAGHGPYAGIKAESGEDWSDYVDRVFTGSNYTVWTWLFSSSWAEIDDTPKGAAARIDAFLDRGGIPIGQFSRRQYRKYLTE